MNTINDVVAAVAESFGVSSREAGLVEAVRGAVPGRYEEVELTEEFLRSVWGAWRPSEAYPFS